MIYKIKKQKLEDFLPKDNLSHLDISDCSKTKLLVFKRFYEQVVLMNHSYVCWYIPCMVPQKAAQRKTVAFRKSKKMSIYFFSVMKNTV